MSMFCFQCEEAKKGKGCDISGICGKPADVANLQDILIFLAKGISFWANNAAELGEISEEVDLFITESLFTTITNVNFDASRLLLLIEKAFVIRDKAKDMFLAAYKTKNNSPFEEIVPDAALWKEEGIGAYLAKAGEVGVLSEEHPDIRSLKELIIYGLKGLAAYVDHAYILGYKDSDVFAFVRSTLAFIMKRGATADELVSLVMETGKFGVNVMALLDKANTSTYGNPEITEVSTGTKSGPGILVSGHDLKDLELLLAQSEGTGVNIYTHGEMLPALAYPAFKKHEHFIGHVGTAWYNQQKEFTAFNGPILMTTNCIVKPQKAYQDRIYTTGLVAWEDVPHIETESNGHKDFAALIEQAKLLGDVGITEGKKITIGFAHDQILALSDKVADAVKSGAIERFVVMGGCDGRHKERSYYTELAEELPNNTVIMTAGCAKFRYNMLDLGDINGIPRVLDAGQCNDSYSLAVVALKLKEVFGLEDINDLPISYDIAWYEQKAIIVLLALLYLGVKGIRLGPKLPAFLSFGVTQVLVNKFDLKPIGTVEEDLKSIMAGQ